MKRILALSCVAFAAACNPTEKSERIYTVEEYKQDDGLRNEQVAKCQNNPGELQFTPNCVNSNSAREQIKFDIQRKSLQQP